MDNLEEIAKAWAANLNAFMQSSQEVITKSGDRLAQCKTEDELRRLQELMLQCFLNMTVAMEDISFWMHRLKKGLE